MSRLAPSLALMAAIAAAGCSIGSDGGGVGEQLGLTKTAPDEFLIIARRPLQLPASFDLPTPRPGAPSRVEPNPFSEAHFALFNRPEPIRLTTPGRGEQVLLSGADASADNSGVRALIDAEDPNAGERKFGATSFFGFPVPASIEDADSVLPSAEETEELRRKGYLTPTAPPIVDEDDNGVIFSGG
ncbi:MAG: DUF3035 domain-containing protein [Pseudomonadota bacterium]